MRENHSDVVIIGAGFGGLQVVKNLRDSDLSVTLIDRHNYHTFQPLLYQVATAGLSPEHVAHSVRDIFQHQENFHFLKDTVIDIEFEGQRVLLQENEYLSYNYAVIAAGASANYFGVEGAREHSIPMKNLSTAIHLQSHILEQFEQAQQHPEQIGSGLLNFVLVGGGPTGVETAGALVELFDHVLSQDYSRQLVEKSSVILLEMRPHLLDPYHETLQSYTLKKLEERGVEIRTETTVERVTNDTVHLRENNDLPTRTLIWAAGVKANPLADKLDVNQKRGGRIDIDRNLTLPEYKEVFAIGDIAAGTDQNGQLLPQLAPVAIQQGTYAAEQIQRYETGGRQKPFVYNDPGMMATIGRNDAVVELPNGLRMSGFLAWIIWVFLHIAKLVGFRNKLMVFLSWIYNYFTYGSSSRLILDIDPERDELVDTTDN